MRWNNNDRINVRKGKKEQLERLDIRPMAGRKSIGGVPATGWNNGHRIQTSEKEVR